MGNCCSERKKISGNLNVTEEQVLDKVRSVQEQLVRRFPELSLRSFDKVDHIKAVDNINSALIIIGTVIEDDFLDNTSTLTQEQLNKIYSFILEIEHLNANNSRNFASYSDIFDDNKELYEKLHKDFDNNPRVLKNISPYSTEVDEATIEKKIESQNQQIASKKRKK